MGANVGSHTSLVSDGQAPPSCTARCGFNTLYPTLLSSWGVGTAVWSDRAWTYTQIGSFSTSAFQFKVQTSVDCRKASYTFVAPPGQNIELYVVGETRQVIAPWAFSAGEPELDGSWSETCETLPEYEAGVTCQFDFCRRRRLQAGETVEVSALAGGKLDVFIKILAAFGTEEWRTVGADLASDVVPDDGHVRPHLKTADGGLRNSCRGRGHRGISPPPAEGWIASKSGWDKNSRTEKWMRRTAKNKAISFFYVPEETHWADIPGRGFMHVDMCLRAIAFLRDTQAWQKQCFCSWKELVSIVQSWRQRLQVMAAADQGEADNAAAGAEDSEGDGLITKDFPVRTAFIAPPALRAAKQRSTTPSKREVTFAET